MAPTRLPLVSVVVNHDAVPDGQPESLSAMDPLAGLAKWIAEGAVDEAAVDRARQNWLHQQANESATMAGTLSDHAEAGRRVMASTLAGRRTNGTVTAIGIDFVAIREAGLGEVMIPLEQLAIIRAAPGESTAIGDRSPRFEVVMAHALAEISVDRPSVLVAAGNEAVRGTLQSVGTDVLAVLVNGPHRSISHVALGAIDHIVILTI